MTVAPEVSCFSRQPPATRYINIASIKISSGARSTGASRSVCQAQVRLICLRRHEIGFINFVSRPLRVTMGRRFVVMAEDLVAPKVVLAVASVGEHA